MRALLALLFLFACYSSPEVARADIDCGSTNEGSPCTGQSHTHSVDGTTFTWTYTCGGGDCQHGRFLDGSAWVRHPSGGSVSINSVSPDDANSGLQRNPGEGYIDFNTEYSQGLFNCTGGGCNETTWDASLDISDELPYLAPADDSVYIKAQDYLDNTTNCGYTSAVGTWCINTYDAMTVLDEFPPDGELGRNTFRYCAIGSGSSKPKLTTDDIDLTRIPAYATISAGDYTSIWNRWVSPYPDYFTGFNGDQGRRWTPHARLGSYDYASAKAQRSLIDIWGLLGNDAWDTDKENAAYALAQYGMEIYCGFQEGVEYTGGAGQQQGRWHAMVFFGTLVTDETIQANIQSATNLVDVDQTHDQIQFTDLYQIRPNQNGVPIWGADPRNDPAVNPSCNQGGFGGAGRYWSDYLGFLKAGTIGKRTCGDPYGYIDGPAESPNAGYNNSVSSPLYVTMALIQRVWPEFRAVANNKTMVDYAVRLMDGAGRWTSDDGCADIDPREPDTCRIYATNGSQEISTGCQYTVNTNASPTWGPASTASNHVCVTISVANSRNWGGTGNAVGRYDELHLQGRPNLGDGYDAIGEAQWDNFSQVNGDGVIATGTITNDD